MSDLQSINLLLNEIRQLVISARKAVGRNIDTIQVITNYEIGRRIVNHEQAGKERADYGKKILSSLSANLTKEFGKGFSLTNLKLMRQFYLFMRNRIGQTLSDQFISGKKSLSVAPKVGSNKKGQTASDQLPETILNQLAGSKQFVLSWSMYVFLMGINDEKERSFYEIEAHKQNWTVRELQRQFNSSLYERLALSRDKQKIKDLSEKGHIVEKPEDMLKNPLVLEFLGIPESSSYSESEIEQAIIDKIEHFLLELGKGFLFEARQKRFTFDEEHFFVDLVFYNRLLRCYVLIDLKIGKITHQDLGQMMMYVNYFDRFVKTKDEHPTVGIVLCKKKKDALVEITLPKDAQIYASEYQLYLPSKEELREKLLEWTEEVGE
jgi:predicted nuclease of restriction endonuclease-like (RecB) superfamily